MQDVDVDDNLLQNQRVSKILEVNIDNIMKFEEHILCNKLSAVCFPIRCVRDELRKDTARLTYFSLFEAHLR